MRSMCIRKRDDAEYRGILIEYVVRIGPYWVKILSVLNVAGMNSLENIKISPYPCEGLRRSPLCYGTVVRTLEALWGFCKYGI